MKTYKFDLITYNFILQVRFLCDLNCSKVCFARGNSTRVTGYRLYLRRARVWHLQLEAFWVLQQTNVLEPE